jgi:hypothetical protein
MAYDTVRHTHMTNVSHQRPCLAVTAKPVRKGFSMWSPTPNLSLSVEGLRAACNRVARAT